jgi:hypothetical protein
MVSKKNSLVSVVLLIVIISVSGCIPPPPEETKESKLKKKRDDLVSWKKTADDRRRPMFEDMIEARYKGCLREQSLREEPKDCDKEKQVDLERNRSSIRMADDRINEIRREVKELEQSASTNENLSK